jgi:hypothetical protein
MSSLLASVAGTALGAARGQFEQTAFARLSGGSGGIDLARWQTLLQNLPGGGSAQPANNAGVVGTGTASATEAAFKSLDANGDGQLSQTEFSAALDRMLERSARRSHQFGPLQAQLEAAQQQASGGVAAPDILRRMLLGYGAAA